jgi:DNA-binding MurR/RpiR family transcriptional regulator
MDGDIILRVQTQTGGPIDDHAPALVLVHIILEMVISRLGNNAQLRFEKIDAMHRTLGEL